MITALTIYLMCKSSNKDDKPNGFMVVIVIIALMQDIKLLTL